MAIIDLSLVTSVLSDLITQGVQASGAWGAATPVAISTLPPDKLSGEALGLYLSHVQETAANRNWPAEGDHVRYAPLTLTAYYQLVANSKDNDSASMLTMQKLFGLALRTLHEHPRVDDTTRFGVNTPLLQARALHGQRNEFRILLCSHGVKEAFEFWSSSNAPQRLTALLEVSTIEIEPQPAPAAGLPVLRYQIDALAGLGPRVFSTATDLRVTLPDGRELSGEIRPASVEPGMTLKVEGAGLADDGTRLEIGGAGLVEPVIADAAWKVKPISAEQVTATVQETAGGTLLEPGIYTLRVRVDRVTQGASGPRRTVQVSNATGFALAPRIASVAAAPPAPNPLAGTLLIDGTRFTDPDAVTLQLGESRLEQVTSVPAAGEFRVVDATTIAFRPPPRAAGQVPLLLTVNGVSSLRPSWVMLP